MLESGAVMKVTLSGLLGSAALACSGLLMATPAQAITIDPIFSSGCASCGIPGTQVSLTTDPQAAAAVEAADTQIESQFGGSMTTNIVYIGVHAGTNSFLGASESGQTVYSYSDYVTALTADATAHPGNTILKTALAHLSSGNGANDPNALVALNTTDARNLGLGLGVPTRFGPSDQTPEFDANGNFVGPDSVNAVADGVVFLNLDQPLSFTRPIQPVSSGVAYDAETTMEHETDELLGIGGAGSVLNTANVDPTNYAFKDYGVVGDLFGPLDLYRYSAPGVANFDPLGVACTIAICGATSPYFSVDGGATSIDTFNQLFPAIGGDAGDWGLDLTVNCSAGGFGGTGDVQDAFTCNNHSADVKPGTPSFDALEAIGYNAVPEPGIWAMMLIGLGLVGAGLRTSRRRHDTAATLA